MRYFLPLLVLAGCGSDAQPAPDAPTEAPHVSFDLTTTIAPGTEVERCKFVTVPDSWVTRDEVIFHQSHHVLVFQTPYTAIPTHKDDDPTPIDTSGVFDCSDGATNGWSVTRVIAGSQNAGGESLLSFPPGVAIHVGGVLLVNVHYINGADEPITPDVQVNLYTMEAGDVQQPGDMLFLYNPVISIRGGTTARAEWSCPVYSDITIANVQSHMHARGIGYTAAIDDQPAFYTNTSWEGVPVQHYDNLVVHAGQHLRYHCDYRNTESRAIYQGPRTTDEMCMLIGSFYPADPRTASCTDPSGHPAGGDWIGQGTATCAATLGCLQGAGGDFHAMTDCVLAAAPAVSHPVSELVRCIASATNPETDCKPQITTCAAM